MNLIALCAVTSLKNALDLIAGLTLCFTVFSATPLLFRVLRQNPETRFLIAITLLFAIIFLGYLDYAWLGIPELRPIRFVAASLIVLWTLRCWPFR